ncbi:hypothetical protein [Pseudactinotalea sp. Z1748]
MRTTANTVADPSVCFRCAGGDDLSTSGQHLCALCVLAELDEEEVVAA